MGTEREWVALRVEIFSTPNDTYCKSLKLNGGEYRNRTGVHGFAIRPVIQTYQGGSVSKQALTKQERNTNVSNADLIGAKENAATSAKVNGVKDCEAVKNSLENTTPDWAVRHPIVATHWGLSA